MRAVSLHAAALYHMKKPAVKTVVSFAVLALGLFACESPKQDAGLPAAPPLALESLDAVVAEQIGEAQDRWREAPRSASANGELAMLLHTYRQLEWAEVFYRRARLLNPGAYEWPYLHAVVLKAQGNTAEEERALRAALAIDPDATPARLRLAQLLANRSDFEQSAGLYEDILAESPDLAQALFGLGTLRLQRGDASGVGLLERAANADGPYGAAHYALASAYRKMGEADKADAELAMFAHNKDREPLLADPLLDEVKSLSRSKQGHMNRALRLLGEGQMQGAAREFEYALDRDASNTAAHIYLVVVYGELNRFAEAEDHYQKGLALDPDAAQLHYNYGVLQLKQRRLDEAGRAFRRAISVDEDYINAYLNLGVVLEAQKQSGAAADQYRAALARDPGNRQAGYFLGRVMLRTGDYSGAASQLEGVLDPVDNRTPDYLLALAQAYAGLNEKNKAQSTLERAIAVARQTGRDDVLRRLDAGMRRIPDAPAQEANRP